MLIAAYNEERTIAISLQSVLNSDYPDFEVIVVNDGSTDNTEAEVQVFLSDPRVRYIKKPNGGKASALNRGLQEARGELVLFTDADSIFEAHTIANGVAYFVDPAIDAVSGNDTPLHPRGLLQKMLVVTSHIGTGFVRRALSMLNVLPIISGNLGLVRTQTLRSIGGFMEIWGEDLEVTVRLHRHGKRVVYGGATKVLAECPSTVRGLWKQRVRWLRSYMKVLRLHAGMLGNLRYGLFGPFLVFNALNMVLVPLLQMVGLVLLPLAVASGDFSLYGWEWIAYLGWGFLFTASVTAILLDKTPRDLLYLPYAMLLIVFSHFYNAVVIYSLWAEMRSHHEAWNKLERRDIRALPEHRAHHWLPLVVGATAVLALGLGIGFWMGSNPRGQSPESASAQLQPLVAQDNTTAVAVHFDAWRDWRDAYRTLLSIPESRYVNHVGVSAGRVDWAYFQWPGQEQWWSNEQKNTDVDMLSEAIQALQARGYDTTAILDTHASRYIQRFPDAAAMDEHGRHSEEVICSTELAHGDYGKLLLAAVEALAARTEAGSIAVTELFYDHQCFDDRCYMDFTQDSGMSDWPRLPNGRIDILHPALTQWRSQQVAAIIQQMATIVHSHGKQLDFDVRVSRDDMTRNSAENGQDYYVLEPNVDRFVVWDYFALVGLPPESSARVAAYFDDEFGPGRSYLSIGLWDKSQPLKFWQPRERYISAAELSRSLNAAALGGVRDVWITPAKEMTAEHWQALAQWVRERVAQQPTAVPGKLNQLM